MALRALATAATLLATMGLTACGAEAERVQACRAFQVEGGGAAQVAYEAMQRAAGPARTVPPPTMLSSPP